MVQLSTILSKCNQIYQHIRTDIHAGVDSSCQRFVYTDVVCLDSGNVPCPG